MEKLNKKRFSIVFFDSMNLILLTNTQNHLWLLQQLQFGYFKVWNAVDGNF